MWQVIGASVRGSGHERSGLPCQDSHGFRSCSDEILIAAVADGLGTAERSEVGSALAVTAVLDTFHAALKREVPTISEDWIDLAKMAFEAARVALEMRAVADDIPIRELGTTLLALVCHPCWLLVGHIGDGAVVGGWPDGTFTILSGPERGEFANVVAPLTAPAALSMVRYGVWAETPSLLVMMSDGLQELALNTVEGEPFEAFFHPLVRVMEDLVNPAETTKELESFLGSDRVNERTDDDKTLVIIRRISNPESAGG